MLIKVVLYFTFAVSAISKTYAKCGHLNSYGSNFIFSDLPRNLKCDLYQSNKPAMDLCCAIEREMEFTWLGHAIPSPGWRFTFAAAGRVFCKENITVNNEATLLELAQSKEPQIQRGADSLLKLLYSKLRPSREYSVYDPTHESYILKNGCSK